MTNEQRVAHERMLLRLPVRTIADDDWLDEPKNWRRENRPLTPAEKTYCYKVADAA